MKKPCKKRKHKKIKKYKPLNDSIKKKKFL